jgi:xanthine/CO dehydrogenase XdhC/CoxF family maturation factor
MPDRFPHRIAALVLASLITPAWAQQLAPWQDRSKHQVHFVTVEEGVRL